MKLDDTVKLSPVAIEDAGRRRNNSTAFIVTLVISILIHGSALAGFALLKEDNKPRIDLNRAIPVKLVKLGKKRDPKLLPRIVRSAPPPKSEGIALETKNKDKKTPNPKKTRPQKEKMSEAARRMLESQALDNALDKFSDEAPEGDPDGDVDGTTTDSANAAAGYHRDIVKTLKSQYRVPTVISPSQRRFLKARVVLFIEANGRISKFEFIESHPNKVFMRALDSLLKTVRLPPPPRKQALIYRRDGVEIIFRP